MALELKADKNMIAKAVLLVLCIITLGITASCYQSSNSVLSHSKEEYFLASVCISFIFTILLFILVLLIEAGSIQTGPVTAKQIDTIGHGLAGILLLIGAIVFSVAVSDWWKLEWKRGPRGAACFFGFVTSFVHFGVAFLAFKK